MWSSVATDESSGIVLIAVNLVYFGSAVDILYNAPFNETYSPGNLVLIYVPIFPLISPTNLYGFWKVPFPPLTTVTLGFKTTDGLTP